jgi:hypothetical protein
MRIMLLLLAAIPALSVAQAIDEFKAAVPVLATGEDPFYRVVVPQPVYEGIAFSDLRDLRVFNGDGEIVPHGFRAIGARSLKPGPIALPLFPLRGPSDTRPEEIDLRVDRTGDKTSVRLQVRGDPGGQNALLGYLIDASDVKTPLSGLRFSWGPQGARQLTSVRIEASDDLKHWTVLGTDVPVGGLSHGGRRLERDSVEFRQRQADYLRVTWVESDRALELAGVQGVIPEQWEQADRMWKEVIAASDATGPGEYLFDLGGRFPIDRLEFRLPQENTVVPLEVLSRADEKQKWMHVDSTVAYRIRQAGREIASPPLAVGPNAHRYWLLRVNIKSGGLGAGNVGVRAGWSPRELVFNARGSGPFQLAFGNPRAVSNAISIETLVPGLRTDQEPQIALVATGDSRMLAGRQVPALSLPGERRKWGLWAALVAGVAVLGWMAWQLSVQMQKAGEK